MTRTLKNNNKTTKTKKVKTNKKKKNNPVRTIATSQFTSLMLSRREDL